MEQKGITNQLFALSTQSIKEEVPETESKDAANKFSPPSSSIKIKHEVDPKSLECELVKDSKDKPGYNIESTCIKTEPMFLPFPYDTKEHLKVDSMLEDSNSDNLLKSSDIVSTESNATEHTSSGFCHVKSEKYHNDDAGSNIRYKTELETAGLIAQSGCSDSIKQRDVSEIDSILPEHLEAKLFESAGSTLLGEVWQSKRTLITRSGKEKPYQCEICNKSFSIRGNMMKHQLTHTDEKQFQCDICEKSFSTKRSMVRHRQTHTKEKQFKCDICEKLFSQKSNLNTHHQSVHHNIRPYRCEICQKSFLLKQHMLSHTLIHTQEKQFKCAVCEKLFSDKSNLNTHKRRVHCNIRPYQCDICQESFSLKHHMMRHKLTHTKETPFLCDICQISFSQNSSLKQHHQQMHCDTKLFQCDICQKPFTSNTYLLHHKLTHTNEKPFPCDICQKPFSLKSYLNKHYKRVHRELYIV